MTNLIAGLGLLSAFIALYVLECLPSELSKMKASLAVGMIYLVLAACVYSTGLLVALLGFNS